MRYGSFAGLSGLALLACTAPTPDAARVSSAALSSSPPGAVAALVGLAAAASPGGASITADEAAGYVAQVPGFGGDESVDALGVLGRFQDQISYPQLTPIAIALRHHVEGLRISGMTVAGLTIYGCGGAVTATFDPEGANYAGVGVVYSGDGWSTAHAATLGRRADGSYGATLGEVDSSQELTFAVALSQPGGATLWMNDPRENRPGAVGHVDYRQALSLCEPVATPSGPPLARFVRAFGLPESDGGAAVTSSEFDWMVSQVTWEGGPGVDDPEVVDPMIAALAALGASDPGGAEGAMIDFLQQMRMRVTTTSAVVLQRNPANQFVQITAPLGTQWMRVYFSTDGWNDPNVVECTPLGRAGYVSCPLGYLPPDTLVSYSAILTDARGATEYVHASDGGNVFEKAR